jgi:3D (Asp-Asp-Asp) domain-containing protein
MKKSILIIVAVVATFCFVGRGNGSGGKFLTKTVTAYCGCPKCCGKWSGGHKTADGHAPKQGVTVAASRAIPFGTKVIILGHTYTVQDRLAAKYDNRIDIYFDNHIEALRFGKKVLQVEILN